MSDLTAAAAAMGVPEAMVKRSAEAKAKATGASVDDILAAWAGGGSAPAAPATPPATAAPAPAPEAAPEPIPAAADSVATPTPTPTPTSTTTTTTPTATAAPSAVVAAPRAVPVLEGRTDRPFLAMIGAAAAIALSLLAGVLAPIGNTDEVGIFSSAVPLTEQGLDGRELYRSLGCGACHTSLVRPLSIDGGLGPVTIADSNQELGYRRFGPDLSNVANRVDDASMYAAALSGTGGHPTYSGLSDEDVTNLVAYLEATNFTPTEEDTQS